MAANGGANGRAGSGDQPMGEADEYEDILGSQLQYRAALPNALRPLGHSKVPALHLGLLCQQTNLCTCLQVHCKPELSAC